MRPPPRELPVVLAELDEVRRHLVDAPPHHGSGVREALHEQLRRLEAELAAARRDRGRDREAVRDEG